MSTRQAEQAGAVRIERLEKQMTELVKDALRSYDPEDRESFRKVLGMALATGQINQGALAEEFKVSAATMSRWLSGRTAPMPGFREAVVKRVSKLLG